jgi:hypothetical protein
MFHSPLFLLSHVMSGTSAACSTCVFAPWAIFLAVYVMVARKQIDAVCADLLLVGCYVTGLALLYPHPAAFACSVDALLYCMEATAQDLTSLCAYSLLLVAAVPYMMQNCEDDLSLQSAAYSICFTEFIYSIHSIVLKLI